MKNAVSPDIHRQAQIALVARMRHASPMHPAPMQLAQRLEKVWEILRGAPPGSKQQFFLKPKDSLSGQTPLEALAAGLDQSVKRAARTFMET